MTTATGDGWTLHCEDSIAGMTTLHDQQIDVTISDPPYEAAAHTKQRRVKRGDICETESLPFAAITIEQREQAGWHIARVTKRWALVFCQVEAAAMWAAAIVSAPFGFEYVRTMVWVKPDAMPQFTGDRPGMGYESIVVCHRKGKKRWNGGGRVGVFVENKNAGRPVGESAPHPTTKPLPLMLDLVELFSEPGELILDPFAGSGSTLVAACQAGRRAVGWELDANYHAIACRRLRGEAARINETQLDLLAGVTR